MDAKTREEIEQFSRRLRQLCEQSYPDLGPFNLIGCLEVERFNLLASVMGSDEDEEEEA